MLDLKFFFIVHNPEPSVLARAPFCVQAIGFAHMRRRIQRKVAVLDLPVGIEYGSAVPGCTQW